MALALPTGFQFSSAFSSPGFWRSGGVGLQFNTSTSTSPTFLAVGFSQTIGGFQRLAFLQFEGNALYGYAWEAGASSLTTFNLRGSSSDIPEPATGALAALALGALAVAARKRKQA
jgi:MYXO-CTERM domain-containing protein